VRVQRVRAPGSLVESWTLLGADLLPVAPVERWLAYLSSVERSPNTIRSYAHDLKDWFTFLTGRDVDWREVRLEDFGGFVGWLRLPPAARAGAASARFLADVGHEIPTALTASLVATTLGAPASALGLIEGISDGLAGAGRFLDGPLADDPHRRRRLAAATPRPPCCPR
jgi:Phage integrase, N-terminal SAM-like domain